MWPHVVLVVSLFINHALGIEHFPESLTVEVTVSEPAMKTLNIR